MGRIKKNLIIVGFFLLLTISIVYSAVENKYVNINMMRNNITNATFINSTLIQAENVTATYFIGNGSQLTGIGESLWEGNYSFVVFNNTGYQNITSQMCYYINNATERTLFTNVFNESYEWFKNTTIFQMFNLSYDVKPNNTYNSSYDAKVNRAGDNMTGNLNTTANVTAGFLFGNISCTNIYNGSDTDFCSDASGGSSEPFWINDTNSIIPNSSYSVNINTSGWFLGNGSKIFDVNYSKGNTITVCAKDSLFKKADVYCNGSYDNECIENAMDMLGGNGGKIVLLDGNYVLNDSIDFTSTRDNLILEGQKDGTILKQYGSSKKIFVLGNSAQYIIIKNMKLQSSDGVGLSTIGFYSGTHTSMTGYTQLDNINFDSLDNGVVITGSWNGFFWITNSRFYNNTRGVHLGYVSTIFIQNNIFDQNQYGVYADGSPSSYRIFIMNNYFYSLEYDQYGAWTNGGAGRNLQPSYGVYTNSMTFGSISNNYMIYGNSTIHIETGTSIDITNNILYGDYSPNSATINISNGQKIVVMGNTMSTGSYNLFVGSGTSDSAFSNNIIIDNDWYGTQNYDGINFNGKRSVIQGNRISWTYVATGPIGTSARCLLNLTSSSGNNSVIGNVLLGTYNISVCPHGFVGCDINQNGCFNNINGSSMIADTGTRFEIIRDDTLQVFIDYNTFNITQIDFAVDQALFVDLSLKRLGIGTNAPSVALDVVGNVKSNNITVTGYINATTDINATTFYENGISLVNKYNITSNITYDVKFNTTATENLNMSVKNITFNTNVRSGIVYGVTNYTLFNDTCWLMQGPTARLEVC